MSDPARPLRIAFAGANAERGWARDAHLAAIRALPGLEIAAISARDRALADAAAPVFGNPRTYGDSIEMAQAPGIDVVAVTVKVPEHRAIVFAALNAGKHVYCEWPLGRDLAEARELAAAAHAAGTHCTIGTQGALAPAVRHAAALVASGAIGRPLTLRVLSPTAGWGAETPPFYAYLEDRRNGATLSTIAGGHTLAAIEAVIGAYRDVSALNSILQPRVHVSGGDERMDRTSPDHMLVIGRHAGGCVSTLEVYGGTPDTPFRFELRGSAGKLQISGGHPGGFQTGHLTVSVVPDGGPQPDVVAPGLEGPPVNVAELWAAFAQDIREGTRTVPDFDRAVRLTQLLDAIDAASDDGLRVDMAA